MRWLIAATAVLCLFASSAHASPQGLVWCGTDASYRQSCGEARKPLSGHRGLRAARSEGQGVIGRRPAGCPRRFCGCEASLYLFGRIDPYLNLASNWVRKFPRANPSPGMAAARPGHVFVLLSHVGGNDWMVRDGNSGGGMTRVHVRSIAGFKIVDPNGNRLASR